MNFARNRIGHPFSPHKLLKYSHAQTLGAFLFRGQQVPHQAAGRRVDLFDGDQLVVHDDQPLTWRNGDHIAILLHGFCGDHRSPYVSRLANKLFQRNVRTIRVDFRGFGSSAMVSRSHLYAGCSHDVESVVRDVHQRSPKSNISLVGFSIGGNILLKLLGEWKETYPQYVTQAIAVSPPVDLVYASWNLRSRGNQLYEAYFVRRLRKSMTLRRRNIPNLVDLGLNPLPDRLNQWDDQLIAPVWGFKNGQDYYEKCSAGPLLKDIEVPTRILWSQDDPIVPFDSIDRFELSNQIELIETRQGGHLGFISGKSLDPDPFWMDWRIIEWIEQAAERDYDQFPQPHDQGINSSDRPTRKTIARPLRMK